jgi:starch synthase (maltosyl-transferring)
MFLRRYAHANDFRARGISERMAQLQDRPTSAAILPDQAAPPSNVLILDVWPTVDCGRFAIKREVGDRVDVWADIFREGHDKIAAHLEIWGEGSNQIETTEMSFFDNDRWTGFFHAGEPGRYRYRIVAYPDPIATKRDEIIKKFDAGIDVSLEIEEFDLILQRIADAYLDAAPLVAAIRRQLAQRRGDAARVAIVSAIETSEALRSYRNIGGAAKSADFQLIVDRIQARFASWYELFPRSAGTEPGKSATFADVEQRLPDIAGMGFDVLYFTPIHPIGTTNRKGKNNSLISLPSDPGVPYAIGSPEGGHDAIEPGLGTIEDFDHLVQAAAEHGMEIALDVAFQASPDHPWAKEHPDWFTIRPDGTIKYAENPPKKYEDIYPINFDSEDWKGLWLELLRVIRYWVDHGVKTFRVDNPHTKPIAFWEWLIRDIHATHPEVIFLSEAFTRPKVMRALAKAGFAQSYTYFTWRTGKDELQEYFTELTGPDVSQYMRGNLFPNTHDINPFHLQSGGRPAFKARFVLAATLSSVYGIYSGFEVCEATPVPGKEEYLNSEKYEYKVWDWDRPGNIKDLIRTVNLARRAHPALQEYDNLHFFDVDDDRILSYAKVMGDDRVVCVVNLDPTTTVDTWLHLDLANLGLPDGLPFAVTEIISGNKWTWTGQHHPIQINPAIEPGWILLIEPLN